MCPNTECVCRISHTTTCTYGFAERDSSEIPIRRHQYDAAFGVVDVYGPSDAYFLYYDILVILPPHVPSVFTEHVTWWPRCYFGLASHWPPFGWANRLRRAVWSLCIYRDFGDFLFSVSVEPTQTGYHWIPKPISPFCLSLFFVSCCFLFLYFDKGESRNVNCLYLSRPEWFITFSIFDIFHHHSVVKFVYFYATFTRSVSM